MAKQEVIGWAKPVGGAWKSHLFILDRGLLSMYSACGRWMHGGTTTPEPDGKACSECMAAKVAGVRT